MGLNNNDRRIVNNLLTDGLEINKGENGKKSIKIIIKFLKVELS